jgi:hypothetical protein
VQNEPRTGARKPEQTDGPLGGRQISNAVDDLAPFVAPYYNTTADRDSAHVDWVTEGHTLTDGMLARVNGIGLMEYVNGEWLTIAASAEVSAIKLPRIIGESHTASQFGNTGTTEVAVTDLPNITGLTLTSGSWYQARVRCRAWAGVAGVQVGLRVRCGVTLNTSSSAVATNQIRQEAVGPTGINDNPFMGDFAVQTTGVYSLGLFGVVASGSFAVGPIAQGRYELIVAYMGPSFPGLATVTS